MTGPASGINGIHHLTAISRDAQRTVDFYTGSLGLRLIKQTVNFDVPCRITSISLTRSMDRAS